MTVVTAFQNALIGRKATELATWCVLKSDDSGHRSPKVFETTAMPGLWNKLFGDRGERAAAKFLKRQGFRIVQRNYSTPWGEIDIVALDGTTIVFVEVKTRSTIVAGRPEEAVNFEKQKKLTNMALAYLKKHKLLEHSARFDVVAIVWPDDAREPEIRHLRNAFEPVGKWQFFS